MSNFDPSISVDRYQVKPLPNINSKLKIINNKMNRKVYYCKGAKYLHYYYDNNISLKLYSSIQYLDIFKWPNIHYSFIDLIECIPYSSKYVAESYTKPQKPLCITHNAHWQTHLYLCLKNIYRFYRKIAEVWQGISSGSLKVAQIKLFHRSTHFFHDY